MSKLKTTGIILVLLFIITANALDLISDIRAHESQWHIIEESLIILFGLSLIGYLLFNLRQQTIHTNTLRQELQTTKQALAKSHSLMHDARKQYSKVIQQQFAEWQLSHSEQEIALLLLKGLSFNEIAALRQTREKTVRQQASEIYKKAGVSGRHAFSAWFFEDFLD